MRQFGYLNAEDDLVFAPTSITIRDDDGKTRTIVNPTLDQYQKYDSRIKEICMDEVPPESPEEGFHYERDGWLVMKRIITPKWVLVKDTPEDSTAHPVSYSRIFLKIAIARLGKLKQFEEWLSSFEVAPGYSALEAFNDANVIRTDFENFDVYLKAAKEALGLDDVVVMQILMSCISRD